MSITILLQQIAVIFLEMGVGYAAVKLHFMSPADSKFLSNLILTVTLPCTILASGSMDAGRSAVTQLLLACVLLEALYLVCTLVCRGIARALRLTPGQYAVLVGTGVMPNSAFIGMPLCSALLGEQLGAVYGAAGILAYNVFFFTYVVQLFQPGKPFAPKDLITPANLSTLAMVALLLTGLRLPVPVQSFLSAMGGCTTPLALIIVGGMLAGSNLKQLFSQKFLWFITFLRCAVFPLAFLLVLWLLPLDRTLCMGAFILASCPAGSLAAVLAKQYDTESELASQAVAHSTLLIVVSAPLLLSLAGKVLGL